MYDGARNLQWTRQFGSIALEDNSGISTDGLGNVYFLGDATGNLSGTNVGGRDVFLSKFREAIGGDYNHDGNFDGSDFLRWQRGQSPLGAVVADLAASQANCGMTLTAVARSTVVPEPTTSLLLFALLAGGGVPRRSPHWKD